MRKAISFDARQMFDEMPVPNLTYQNLMHIRCSISKWLIKNPINCRNLFLLQPNLQQLLDAASSSGHEALHILSLLVTAGLVCDFS
ncbi:hypothetical protein IEQ34_007594 [Dendrobium chrysotoxum]|uniref:Uncharacterized protein n=1 Tax=Dendrobium chrysotoxum TaxID=161865 RepID=A0AAV7H3X4_DENCH|nr:hypothetical protein IEQ34_007594 [Dendrobium chrysotoxum]